MRHISLAYDIESYRQHLQCNSWLTLSEIARKIGVYPHTARTYAKEGLLRAIRVNGKAPLFEPRTDPLPHVHRGAGDFAVYFMNLTQQMENEEQYE